MIDINLAEREVLVVGGGSVGERKALKFLTESCNIVVGSKNFTNNLKRLGEEGKVKLVEVDAERDDALLKRLISKADIVIAATNDIKINEEIANKAKSCGALVCVVDNLSISDFSLVTTTNVGEIQIAVFTGGRSPAMARLLRKRIEKTITERDALQVEILYHARGLAKTRISDKKLRRDAMYSVLKNNEINRLIDKGLFKEAKVVVEKIIDQY